MFALEINYFPVLSSLRALLARLPKRNKRKVVLDSRVTLPVNFACKPGLYFNHLARVILAVGLPYILVNRALVFANFVIQKKSQNLSAAKIKDTKFSDLCIEVFCLLRLNIRVA